MKITIFGATGPTGIEVIKQALAAGHEIVAFARAPEKLHQVQHKRLSIVKGELSDRAAIEQAICGTDAVISLLGPGGNVNNTVLSDGMENIIDSMKKSGIRRIIALSTGSVRDEKDLFDVKYRILIILVKLGVRGAYEEIIKIGDLIRSSDLEWTLVRVGLLTNKPTRQIKDGYYGHGSINVLISRQSIAKFMLDQLTSTKYVRKSPAISN